MAADGAVVRMRVLMRSESPCNGIWTRLARNPGDASKVHVNEMTLMGLRLEPGEYRVTFERVGDDDVL